MSYGYAPPPYQPPPRDPTAVMGKRVVAYLIDVALASAIFIALLAATKDQTYVGVYIDDGCRVIRDIDGADQCLQLGNRAYTWTGGAFLLSWGLAALVGMLNNVILQTATGASVGKMIMGLRVVDADGQTAGLGRQFVRWLLLIVDAGFCFVGFFVAAFTHPHRRLGDTVAKTFVVAAADAGRPLEFAVAPPALGQQFGQAFGQQYGQPSYVPPPPQQNPWGQPQAQPQWGAAPQQPPYQQQTPYGTPQPQWGTPAPPQPAPQQPQPAQPPAYEPPTAPYASPPQQPPAYEPPPPQPPPAYEPPPQQPPAYEPPPTAPPAAEPASESWWDRAVADDNPDEEPK